MLVIKVQAERDLFVLSSNSRRDDPARGDTVCASLTDRLKRRHDESME
jgi:hypothetical protein